MGDLFVYAERWPLLFVRERRWLSWHICLTCHFVCISVAAALAAKAVRPVGFFRLDLMIRNLLLGLKKDLVVWEKCSVPIDYFSLHYTLNFPKLPVSVASWYRSEGTVNRHEFNSFFCMAQVWRLRMGCSPLAWKAQGRTKQFSAFSKFNHWTLQR